MKISYICMCVCAYIYIYAHRHTHICIYNICRYVDTCIHTYMNVSYTFVCIYAICAVSTAGSDPSKAVDRRSSRPGPAFRVED